MNFKLLLPLVSASLLFNADLLQAQVVEDGTLATEVTAESDRKFRVGGGEQRGDNLFHSFDTFSLVENGSVVFDNALTIQNIISRVTGSSISNINGLIQNNGTANLFLLNPNGIIFGENATLNIGGSFIGTTASNMVFEDGVEFGTNLDSPESLLTVSTPLGLQFGNNSRAIVNQANLTTVSLLGSGNAPRKIGLVGAPEKTLALIGNGITFDGGAVTVASGNIELISVAENSFISLESISEGWSANYNSVTQFRNIKLDNLASIDTSGASGGSINVIGENINILGGSAILSNTRGNGDGKSINIQAANLVRIDGSDTAGEQVDPLLASFEIFLPFASQISSNTLGAGNGGDINLTAKNLQLIDGGSIELQTLPRGTGNGGNLSIAVEQSVELKGFRPLLGVGANATNLVLPEIGLDQAIDLNQGSEISTATINSGQGGDIQITAQNLRLENGSVIGVTPFASGNGGEINLNIAESLLINGTSSRTGSTSSVITANTFATGDAGNINITAGKLKIKNGGQLISATSTTAAAGDINIVADSVEIKGINSSGQNPSRISADTQNEGNGGNIFLETNNLSISDRATLSVQGSSAGRPGSLIINANSVELQNSASIIAETEFGTGGNIDLNVRDRLTLRNDSLVSAQAFDSASGGNLSIDADFIVAFPQENNDILANAMFGSGGNIAVDTLGIFGLEERNSFPANSTNDLDASSEFGTAGLVSISFPTVSQVEGQLETSADKLDVDSLFRNTFCKLRGNNRFVVTGRGGIPQVPDNTILPKHTWSDWRLVETAANLNIEAEEEASEILTVKLTMIQGWIMDAEGNVVLTDQPSTVASQAPALNDPNCNQFKQEVSSQASTNRKL